MEQRVNKCVGCIQGSFWKTLPSLRNVQSVHEGHLKINQLLFQMRMKHISLFSSVKLQVCCRNIHILILETSFLIFCFSRIDLYIFMHNIHKISFEKQSHLKHMTSEELKLLLSKLENQHDILQATNEELTIQISDLRNAVKCVEAERKENVVYEVEKKKELENKIESLEKGLKYAKQNKSYETMEVYKAMME